MERTLCVLIDHENIATGCEKEGLGRFDIRVVMRRLKDKGRILVSRAYADWGRWNRYKQDYVEQGVTMVELTSHGMQDKNRADIALAVDAMELAYTRGYIDTFVILSGDSDFTPLVMRLKELNRRVLGCGTRRSTSRLIAETCDEFFFYDVLKQEARPERRDREERPADVEDEALTVEEAFELLVETLENHQRDEPVPVHASVLKASMKRKEPTFSEVDLGMRTFARFLETAQERGLVTLTKDERAGGVRVDVPHAGEPAEPPPPDLGPDAARLAKVLADAGLEVGTARARKAVIEQLVAVCDERGKKGRKCALQYVIGDLLRRCREEKVEVPPRIVRGIVNALLKAGLLIHPDGEPVRTQAAPFVAPGSAEELLGALNAHVVATLREKGEDVEGEGARELLAGEVAAAPEPEAAEDKPKKRSRRGGRRSKKKGEEKGEGAGEE
ncbi:MAG: NYN domain-containing protein [Myxococcota bacterium]